MPIQASAHFNGTSTWDSALKRIQPGIATFRWL